MEEIARCIQADEDRVIGTLQALIRQPSVSSTGEGLSECAAVLADMAGDAGLRAQVISTTQFPRVFAEGSPDPSKPTLLITSHYDVQPAEPLDEWTHPPYGADVVGDRIIGRGSTDAKGNVVAVLEAIRVLHAVRRGLPVNVKLLFDGEEEIGSPSLPGFLAEHEALLRCDAVVTFDAGFEPVGRPFIWLGNCGLLTVEVEVEAGAKEVHSSRARLVPNAAWGLVWLLGLLKAAPDRVLIPGFYARVRPPNPEEESLLESMPWDELAYRESVGVSRFIEDVKGIAAKRRLHFEPTCTITGLVAGYTGVGTKEAIPHRARAKLEFRLVADQDPDDVYALLMDYLREVGPPSWRATVQSKTEPSQCRLMSIPRRALERAAQRVYGVAPVIRPRHESSGRQGTWMARRLGVDGAITGIGPPNWNGHGPNEFMTRHHLLKGVEYVAATLEEFSSLVAEDPGTPGAC